MGDEFVDDRDDLSARQAIGEIERVDRKVRRSSRAGGWWFTVLGLATIAYWSIMYFGGDPLPQIASWAWVVFTLVSIVWVFRMPVFDRVLWRLQWPVTLAYLAMALIDMLLVERLRGATGWSAALAVVLTLFTAAPPLYGAWRALTALDAER